MKKQRVVVGMSGGVDSSVAALLLKERGFDVVGLFMTNWKETDENGCCTAEEDYADVRAVSDVIGIPYYTTDFSREYWDRVFKLFVDEYKKGRTPNPDVLCNREVKFGPFKRFAMELGAEFVATGHYAQSVTRGGVNYLMRAADGNKDQTYFLNQLTNAQLDRILFPIGNMTKPEVRVYAEAHGVPTAAKKDSTGICFIGERDFRRFLQGYIPMKEGDMVDVRNGKTVGRHNGVFYYTNGQRHGLGIGGAGNGEPWFVVRRDVEKNILYVSQGEPPELFSDALETDGFNFISGVPVPDSGACNGDYKDGAHTHEQASSGACKDGTNTNGKPFNGACNGADNKDTHANGQSVTPRADIDKGACRSFEPHTLPPDNLSFITVAEAVSRETGFNCLARIRHRQPLQEAFATVTKDGCVRVTFASPQRAVASGQYCVLYVGNLCIGGGVIR